MGNRCQYRDVCISSSCPTNQVCVHTVTRPEGFSCQDLSVGGSGQSLVVTVDEGDVHSLGQLDDQVNTIQEVYQVRIIQEDIKDEHEPGYCFGVVCLS